MQISEAAMQGTNVEHSRPAQSGMLSRAANRIKLKTPILVAAFAAFMCAFLKVPGGPLTALVLLLIIRSKYKLRLDEFILVWLIASPLLETIPPIDLGGIPDLPFSRLFAFVALIILTRERRKSGFKFFFNRLDAVILVFMTVVFTSILGCFMYKTPLRLFLDSTVIPICIYILTKTCAQREDFIQNLGRTVTIALIIMGTLGAIETLGGVDVLHCDFERYDDLFRTNGPMVIAEHFGLTVDFFILLVVILGRNIWDGAKVSRIGSIILGVVAVFGTLTRGIWLALLGSATLRVMRRGILSGLLTLLLVLPVSVLLFQVALPSLKGDVWERRVRNKGTIRARLATFESARRMFEDHPFLGVGFGAFTEAYERDPQRYYTEYEGEPGVGTPHNSFFAVMAETGTIGLLAYLALIGTVFVCAGSLSNRSPDRLRARYGEAVICITTAYIIASFGLDFTHNMGYLNQLYYALLGVLSGSMDVMASAKIAADRAILAGEYSAAV